MESELNGFEEKLNQLIALTRKLRGENQHLRQQLAEQLDNNKRLSEKLESATQRLESILTQVPEV